MGYKNSLFMRGISKSYRTGFGLESEDKQQEAIAPIEPIERKKEGVTEDQANTSIAEKAKKDFGDGGNALRENDEEQLVNEMQAAAEAISERISVYQKYCRALEELADQLDDTVPEGGVTPETAELLQTALGASEVPEVQEAVAVESFGMDQVTATANLASTLRARSRAVSRVVSRFQAKALG